MPGKTVLFIIAWTFLGVGSTPTNVSGRPGRNSECSNRHYQRCMKLIYHLSESNMKQTTVEDLNRLCRKWEQTVLCIDNHQARCFSEEQSRLFNQVLATPRQYLTMLCGNPQLQQEYLKFAQCDANITKDEAKCGGVFQRVLQISQEQPAPPTDGGTDSDNQRQPQQRQQESVEQVLAKNCCTFDEYLRCKKRFLTRDCGDNASQFFETHIKRISAPFAEEQCGAFVQRCDHVSSAMTAPYPALLLVNICLIIAVNNCASDTIALALKLALQ
ncbi:uncharacterized protein LOC111271264 isoform X1 [Varroa jacobsoni]|uniref:uncharacterized protein LOC111271264 isoform X1 n=1 Tax=Varroa jacobsoni TaxID=62625 RepID=UPI000BF880B3|nr:uncharacterized protein LOC111271264 isoform X1 [Varroa jacobsoni]XP_022707694.1 uncharacterized protein LOC111271264 isoform X1 [Varroa jacobsoni]